MINPLGFFFLIIYIDSVRRMKCWRNCGKKKHSSLTWENSPVLRYLSPALAKMVYTLRQAAKLAPEEMPTRRPSSAANLRACAMASSELTVTTSSTSAMSRLWGMKPGPIPWISCSPSGSTQTIFIEGFLDLRNLPAPEMVPPDPDPQTKISTLPAHPKPDGGAVLDGRERLVRLHLRHQTRVHAIFLLNPFQLQERSPTYQLRMLNVRQTDRQTDDEEAEDERAELPGLCLPLCALRRPPPPPVTKPR
ncbi:unnamed protein product [Spirodela intermedia]|uniref:Uncharacterized protein n=1 Tax=Spirodela intermedia TaxID=51605 RepID=A0A7I8KZZ0_SPIIN|nr:unnamed protein product [Spirodela intermedia]